MPSKTFEVFKILDTYSLEIKYLAKDKDGFSQDVYVNIKNLPEEEMSNIVNDLAEKNFIDITMEH